MITLRLADGKLISPGGVVVGRVKPNMPHGVWWESWYGAIGSYAESESAALTAATTAFNEWHARILGDSVVVPRELLVKLRDELKDSLDAIGGCDHAVGVCCCESYRTLEDTNAMLTASEAK